MSPSRQRRALRTALPAAIGCALALVLASPATAPALEPDPLFDILADEDVEVVNSFPDPHEKVNRMTFRMNGTVDRWLLDPITITYRALMPDPVQRALVRVLENLNSPVVIVNDTLQGRFEDAGIIFWRLVVNTTVGVGGIFDPSSALGVEGHRSDFGLTLVRYGVPSGPYLILPLFGPTTARDSAGSIVDLLLRPTTYFLSGTDQLFFSTIQGTGSGLSWRADSMEAMQALRASSIDYYAALRSAYYQNRMSEIRAMREPVESEP